MNWTPEQVEAHNKRIAEGGKRRTRPFVPTEYVKAMPPAVKAISATADIKASTDEQKLNKTERLYLQYLKSVGVQWIGVQAVTLKLGDDCRYTPDFVVIDASSLITAHEVKGFWRDDARVKIKVAARSFPWMAFVAAQKSKTGWNIERINP
jgi:hypothetical protein